MSSKFYFECFAGIGVKEYKSKVFLKDSCSNSVKKKMNKCKIQNSVSCFLLLLFLSVYFGGWVFLSVFFLFVSMFFVSFRQSYTI